MVDSTLNRFLASGTNAERLAFTPDPPVPASGPDPTYLWFETDTGDSFAWDYDGASWEALGGGGDVTALSTSLSQVSSSLSGAISSTTSLSGAVSTVDSNQSTSLSQISSSLSGAISSTTSLSTAVSTVVSGSISTTLSTAASATASLSTAVGGGSADKASAENSLAAASSGLHCAKGVLIVPLTDIVVYGAWCKADEISTGVYRYGLYEIDGSNTITAVKGTTATQTAAATAAKFRYFPFASGLTMTKGLRYALLHIRTDAATTTSSGCYGGTLDAKGVPIEQGATFLQYDKTAPAVSDTVANSGANPHHHGFTYSVV